MFSPVSSLFRRGKEKDKEKDTNDSSPSSSVSSPTNNHQTHHPSPSLTISSSSSSSSSIPQSFSSFSPRFGFFPSSRATTIPSNHSNANGPTKHNKSSHSTDLSSSSSSSPSSLSIPPSPSTSPPSDPSIFSMTNLPPESVTSNYLFRTLCETLAKTDLLGQSIMGNSHSMNNISLSSSKLGNGNGSSSSHSALSSLVASSLSHSEIQKAPISNTSTHISTSSSSAPPLSPSSPSSSSISYHSPEFDDLYNFISSDFTFSTTKALVCLFEYLSDRPDGLFLLFYTAIKRNVLYKCFELCGIYGIFHYFSSSYRHSLSLPIGHSLGYSGSHNYSSYDIISLLNKCDLLSSLLEYRGGHHLFRTLSAQNQLKILIISINKLIKSYQNAILSSPNQSSQTYSANTQNEIHRIHSVIIQYLSFIYYDLILVLNFDSLSSLLMVFEPSKSPFYRFSAASSSVLIVKEIQETPQNHTPSTSSSSATSLSSPRSLSKHTSAPTPTSTSSSSSSSSPSSVINRAKSDNYRPMMMRILNIEIYIHTLLRTHFLLYRSGNLSDSTLILQELYVTLTTYHGLYRLSNIILLCENYHNYDCQSHLMEMKRMWGDAMRMKINAYDQKFQRNDPIPFDLITSLLKSHLLKVSSLHEQITLLTILFHKYHKWGGPCDILEESLHQIFDFIAPAITIMAFDKEAMNNFSLYSIMKREGNDPSSSPISICSLMAKMFSPKLFLRLIQFQLHRHPSSSSSSPPSSSSSSHKDIWREIGKNIVSLASQPTSHPISLNLSDYSPNPFSPSPSQSLIVFSCSHCYSYKTFLESTIPEFVNRLQSLQIPITMAFLLREYNVIIQQQTALVGNNGEGEGKGKGIGDKLDIKEKEKESQSPFSPSSPSLPSSSLPSLVRLSCPMCVYNSLLTDHQYDNENIDKEKEKEFSLFHTNGNGNGNVPNEPLKSLILSQQKAKSYQIFPPNQNQSHQNKNISTYVNNTNFNHNNNNNNNNNTQNGRVGVVTGNLNLIGIGGRIGNGHGSPPLSQSPSTPPHLLLISPSSSPPNMNYFSKQTK